MSKLLAVRRLPGLAQAAWIALLGLSALLVSCGGGTGGLASSTGTDSGVGSGGTGSYTNGPISGLGSIIVNGVRYDVSGAAVVDDEGRTGLVSADLALGMTVEVLGSSVVSSAASASQVRVASALLGPVTQAPDSACTCLYVMGQPVRYSATTVLATSLQVGEVVEVHAQPDWAQGVWVGTRVDRVTDTSRDYKMVGWVQGAAALNTSAQSVSVFGVGNPPGGAGAATLLHYTDATTVQALTALSDTTVRQVRVWVGHAADGSATNTLLRLTLEQRLSDDDAEARLEGRVTSLVDAQGMLGINGSLVDVSGLASSATLAKLALGDLVLVEGQLVGGALQVSEIHLGGDDDDDSGDLRDDLELHGAPTQITALGGDQASMVVHDVTVLYQVSAAPANLSSLSCVTVQGSGFDAQGRLLATSVVADDSCR